MKDFEATVARIERRRRVVALMHLLAGFLAGFGLALLLGMK